MIIVDDRGGSLGIEGAKRRLDDLRMRGADAELGRLEFGDYGFAGNGPEGRDVMIGVELKRTTDLLTSLRKRLPGHQLPGLSTMYDKPWLLTEGIWREGAEGNFEHYQGHWTTVSVGTRVLKYRDMVTWLLSTLEPWPKVRHWHCSTGKDTALFITALHHWWTDKAYEEHRLDKVIYLPPPERAFLTEPSPFIKGMVASVEGLGWTKAHALEAALVAAGHPAKFTSLTYYTAKDLQTVDGIGPTLAKRILEVV